ncbi:MAG: dTDP-4-dehydrorhamnose 3,5-epimerase [Flavobacteriales bacterium]|jgi:dTDP-4-dehydrorhamnose 3,5-epimerase
MKFISTAIPEVKILEPQVFGDTRGFFMETFRVSEFNEHCGEQVFVQENHSSSSQGILRGMHYQIHNPQGKLVRVVSGSVFDVAVDMRQSSATFGQWVGVELSAQNKRQLWVPEGFAHGFYVTSESAEFVYKCTNYYTPEHERLLNWNEPKVAIEWPLVVGQEPLLSAKDCDGKSWDNLEFFK